MFGAIRLDVKSDSSPLNKALLYMGLASQAASFISILSLEFDLLTLFFRFVSPTARVVISNP